MMIIIIITVIIIIIVESHDGEYETVRLDLQ